MIFITGESSKEKDKTNDHVCHTHKCFTLGRAVLNSFRSITSPFGFDECMHSNDLDQKGSRRVKLVNFKFFKENGDREVFTGIYKENSNAYGKCLTF